MAPISMCWLWRTEIWWMLSNGFCEWWRWFVISFWLFLFYCSSEVCNCPSSDSDIHFYDLTWCNECIECCRIFTLISVGRLVVVASASLVIVSIARSELPVPALVHCHIQLDIMSTVLNCVLRFSLATTPRLWCSSHIISYIINCW